MNSKLPEQCLNTDKLLHVAEYNEGESLELGFLRMVKFSLSSTWRFVLKVTPMPMGHWPPYKLNPAVEEDAKDQFKVAINARNKILSINADFIMKTTAYVS